MLQRTTFPNLERLSTPDAELYLQGAHLTRFRDWLFVSQNSQFAPNQSIRGGVPVIFPWFGPNAAHPDAPMHGFARTAIWTVDEATDNSFQLSLSHETASHSAWPFTFGATLKFTFSDQLTMRLEIENRDVKPFRFESAFHTYFSVDEIARVEIDGLDGKTYLDKTRNYAREVQRGTVQIDGECDRVYLDAGDGVSFSTGARRLQIKNNEGWRSTVVWNPGAAKAAQMKDLGDEWTRFVCVECGQIGDDATELQPGETGALDVSIALQSG